MTEAAAVVDGAAGTGRTVGVAARTGRPLKHRVRSCLDRAAMSTGLLTWCERRMRRGLTVLMYHRVLPAEQCAAYPLQSLVMPAAVFAEQVRWLATHCRVLPVREALAEMDRGGPYERPLVSLTFDDGYADNAEIAAPAMEACGVRGTFFITTGFVDDGGPMWFDRAADVWGRLDDRGRESIFERLRDSGYREDGIVSGAEGIGSWMEGLKRIDPAVRLACIEQAEARAGDGIGPESYRPMTIEQVKALHDGGHEVASHTVTHPILPQLDDAALRDELLRSGEQLRAWTGGAVDGFCYPNGDVDGRVEQAVRDGGYGYACTTESGLNEPGCDAMRLARLPITMQRTVRGVSEHDEVGFRAEVSRLRQWWRGS